ASSRPPPRQKPRISASVGYGTAASWLNTSQPRLTMASASSTVLTASKSSMSAPAMKPLSLPERTTRPFGGAAASSLMIADSSVKTSAESELVEAPARSKTNQAMPSALRSSLQLRAVALIGASRSLDQHGAAQAAADADGREAAPAVAALEHIEHVQHDARARGAYRVS